MRLLHRLQPAIPYLVVLAAAAFLYNAADHFEYSRTPGRIGPDLWPKLILGLMTIVALWGIISKAISGQPAEQPPKTAAEEAEALVHPPEIYPYLVWLGIAATLGYALLLPILGFFISSILYVGIVIILGQYRNLPYVLGISIVLPLFFMVLFMRIVYVALPIGAPPFDKVSLAIMSMIGVR